MGRSCLPSREDFGCCCDCTSTRKNVNIRYREPLISYSEWRREMDQYEVYDSIGRGAFATCQLARRKEDGRLLVVKTMSNNMAEMSQSEKEDIETEVRVLGELNHPNIVQYVGSFVSNDMQHIVMEWAAGGSLASLIKNAQQNFPEEQIWEWFAQMCIGLRYVHQQNILHRDIKPQNILLWGNKKRVIKIADFGIAKVLNANHHLAATLVGTPFYLSPELCEGRKYDTKSDIWSLGCVLYEMMALRKPFLGDNIPSLVLAITSGRFEDFPAPALEYSSELHQVVASLLNIEPACRPSMDELCEYPAVQQRIQLWNAIQDAVVEVEAKDAQKDADDYIFNRQVLGSHSHSDIVNATRSSSGLSESAESLHHSRRSEKPTSPRSSGSLFSNNSRVQKRGLGNIGTSALERHSVVYYTTGGPAHGSRRKNGSPSSTLSQSGKVLVQQGQGSERFSRSSGVSTRSNSSGLQNGSFCGYSHISLNSLSDHDARVVMTRFLSEVSRVYKFGSGQRNPVLDDKLIGLNVEKIASPRFLGLNDETQFSIILCEEGDVLSFGSNNDGCLGNKIAGFTRTPSTISYFIEREIRIVAISCGDSHCAAVSSDGKLYLWGDVENAGGKAGLSLKQEIANHTNVGVGDLSSGSEFESESGGASVDTPPRSSIPETKRSPSLRAFHGSNMSENSVEGGGAYDLLEEPPKNEVSQDWPTWAKNKHLELQNLQISTGNSGEDSSNPFASPKAIQTRPFPMFADNDEDNDSQAESESEIILKLRSVSESSEDKLMSPSNAIAGESKNWPTWARSRFNSMQKEDVSSGNPFASPSTPSSESSNPFANGGRSWQEVDILVENLLTGSSEECEEPPKTDGNVEDGLPGGGQVFPLSPSKQRRNRSISSDVLRKELRAVKSMFKNFVKGSSNKGNGWDKQDMDLHTFGNEDDAELVSGSMSWSAESFKSLLPKRQSVPEGFSSKPDDNPFGKHRAASLTSLKPKRRENITPDVQQFHEDFVRGDLEKLEVVEAREGSAKSPTAMISKKMKTVMSWMSGSTDMSQSKSSTSSEAFEIKAGSTQGMLQVGARVHLVAKREVDCGTIKFVGFTQFAPGLWVGVELDRAEGKNDGEVKGTRYFEAKQGHGLFVRPQGVRVVVPGEEFQFETSDGASNGPQSPRLKKMQQLSNSQRLSFRSTSSSLDNIKEEGGFHEEEEKEDNGMPETLESDKKEWNSSNLSAGVGTTKASIAGDWLYQLEDHSQPGPLHEPRLVYSLASSYAIEVVCGAAFTAIVTREGRVFTFGENDYGQLGNGTDEASSVPCEVHIPGCTVVKAIAAGGEHMMAISGQGQLFAWGNGSEGQLGQGEDLYDEANSEPLHVSLITSRVTAIACGRAHSAAITEQGEIWTFGCGEEGQLGHGSLESINGPEQVESLGRLGADIQVVDVACGSSFTAVVTDSRTVYCWGNIQRSHAPSLAMAIPRPVEALVGAGVQTICCGSFLASAIARVENPQDGL